MKCIHEMIHETKNQRFALSSSNSHADGDSQWIIFAPLISLPLSEIDHQKNKGKKSSAIGIQKGLVVKRSSAEGVDVLSW
jgi:hypothetical protein